MKTSQCQALLGTAAALALSVSAYAGPNLSGDEHKTISEAAGGGMAGGEGAANKQWYDRIDIGGSIAAGFMQTGDSRTDLRTGHFGVHEATIDIDATPWE